MGTAPNQVIGTTPSRPNISTRPGSRLLIWWAMTPAGSRPVITRAIPIGIATTSSNGVRVNSRWASAKTKVVITSAHHRLRAQPFDGAPEQAAVDDLLAEGCDEHHEHEDQHGERRTARIPPRASPTAEVGVGADDRDVQHGGRDGDDQARETAGHADDDVAARHREAEVDARAVAPMRVISAASPAAQSVGTESASAIAHAEDVRLPASA